jgi:hypothetical protein
MIFNGDPANGPVGLLTVLTDPEVLGEWSLTFNNSTDFTLTGPGGVSTNGSIPAGSASVFNDNMNVYFGHQPNSRANIYQTGQTLTLNHIAITGPDAIDDYFTMPPLDTNYWATCAAVSSVIRIVPWNTWWIIDWSVPAPGFTLQTSANLMTGWFDLPEQTASAVMPIDHMLAVITNGLPANDTGFFRMVKRTFAKLQILLPGMTGAPNTESGYTGTPADQVAFTPFSVIVHSVDSNWNVVNNSSDTIHLSSSDTGNFFVVNDPADLTLSSGTATFSVEELGDGSGTITATDVTDGSKTAAESPIVNY